MDFANQENVQHDPVTEIGDHRLHIDDAALPFFSTPWRPGTADAIVVIHGALRDAAGYLRHAQEAARLSTRAPLIVAPQFLTDLDASEEPAGRHLLRWSLEGWKGGLGRVSSFHALDQLLIALTGLPGLRRVTIVGNSAGGQFVNRYAAVGHAFARFESGGRSLRFVVANPSTYLYFDRNRPTAQGFEPHPDPRADRWRYGFGADVPRYVRISAEECFHRYVRRDVTYLLGERDQDPGAVLLEVHSAATAQGRDRRERGEFYHRYLCWKAGRPVHRLVVVPGVGHDAQAVFTSPEGLDHLLG